MDITKAVSWVVKNYEKIPDSFKSNLQGEDYYRNSGLVPGLKLEEHVVIMLLDRQKPSVEKSYSFDEERISVNKKGIVIWGFDSGCSCPSPWHDNYPGCYSCSAGWKEFEMNLEKFDSDAAVVCLQKIQEIKNSVK